jgi:hypothetical protein
MRSLTLLPLMICLVAPARASASVALALSVEQLTLRADLVVRGHVVGQESAWTRGGRIVTTVHLAVDAALKGQASGTVKLVHLGGHVGDIGQQVSGEVAFTQGEEVVVFLRVRSHQPQLFQVLGMSQGKFTVDRTGPVATARQGLEGLGLIARPGGSIEERPGTAVALPQLLSRISRAAGR